MNRSSNDLAREFRFLRTRIEAEVPAPALLLVTSATARDGAGLTAFGLAEALSKSHQRAVLLTTEPGGGSAPTRLSRGDDETFRVVELSPERIATMSRTAMGEIVRRLRAEADYIIVDAGNLPENGFAMLLLSTADASLIAFRAGRSELPADRTMIETLERSKAKLLGVVMTDRAAISDHARRNETVEQWEARGKASTASERVSIKLHGAEKAG